MSNLAMIKTTNSATDQRSPRAKFLGDDERWEAVAQRDRTADGTFFYSVRDDRGLLPSVCAARLPRRENVSYHASRADAERAGFRPCKRCRPDRARTRRGATRRRCAAPAG